MNRNDEQFDEFLRSQFNQKTFEMKDQYWMNAQELMATHRATAGQGMLNMVLSGIVLVALSAGLLWNSANTPSAAQQEQSAFLATSAPEHTQGLNAPVETGNVALQTGSSQYQPESSATNSSVSSKSPQAKTAQQHTNPTQPKKHFIQHQRTRKSALAERANTTIPASEELVTPNTPTDVTYINGLLFRPIKGVAKGTDATHKTPDFLAYTVNRSKGFLTIEGGLNSYNPSSDFAQSLNFHAGLRYYRFLTPRFAVSSGLTYSRVQQNMDALVFRNIDYSFGQNTRETKITTLRLDYLEIPLSAYYNVKGNHYVQAGATIGYAIQSTDFVESNGNKGQSDNGYMDGINRLDIQLNAGYACLIQNRYTFSAGYYYGLTDVSKNAIFNSNKADHNSGIRLTIGYKLF
jgi:hypothetical protein